MTASSRLSRLLLYLAKDVNNLTLRSATAREAIEARQWQLAEELLRAPEMLQGTPSARILRARCLHHLERHAEAIEQCEMHLAAVPSSAEAHGLLALLQYEKGQPDNARQHVEAALRLEPQQLEATLTRGSMYLDARQYEAAHAYFNAVVQAHSACGRAWLGLALVDLSMMQMDAALTSIKHATVYLPEHVGTWHALAWIQVMRQDVEAAARAFERALVLNRNFAETHGGLAVVAALQGRQPDADVSIRRALRLDPQSLAARYARILLFERQGRRSEAQAVLDGALSLPMAPEQSAFRDLVEAQLKTLKNGS